VPLLKIGAWALSNLCDGQPRKVLDMVMLGPLLGMVSHLCYDVLYCDVLYCVVLCSEEYSK
jgi:hypothetical protein